MAVPVVAVMLGLGLLVPGLAEGAPKVDCSKIPVKSAGHIKACQHLIFPLAEGMVTFPDANYPELNNGGVFSFNYACTPHRVYDVKINAHPEDPLVGGVTFLGYKTNADGTVATLQFKIPPSGGRIYYQVYCIANS
jgi:hypothetical protein